MGRGAKRHHGAIRGFKIDLTFTRQNQRAPTGDNLSQYTHSFSGILIHEKDFRYSDS